MLRADPEGFDRELEVDLVALSDVAEAYKAACGQARAVLRAASDRCGEAARALRPCMARPA